jgi:hypothetical protein
MVEEPIFPSREHLVPRKFCPEPFRKALNNIRMRQHGFLGPV